MGERIHILLEDPDVGIDAPMLLWELTESGITNVGLEIAEPTPEDVFVAATGEEAAPD